LRILSYNIRLGGVDRDRPIAAVIKSTEPDVVILQEAIRTDVVDKLADACGMKFHAALPGHSLAFLSRLPVKHHEWHQVPLARRRYLELVLENSVRVFGVHLAAIHSNLTEQRRVYELRSLLKGIQHHQHGFHLLTGDFNTVAPGAQFDMKRLPARLQAILWLTGRSIKWRTIRLMLDGGYVDAYRLFFKDDEGYTFPTWDPHVRLDYTFVPAPYAARLTSCRVVREPAAAIREASDHFPLLTECKDDEP
jgi:exodeoxyribonuclease-3